ncbi:MAG TPA: type VI secretion system baseplate subunit TssK [Polyangiaceae bacterium]|nr:type VI secretion system baseplate subunit TssK [Polyangiaceae bacterium]
MSTKPIWTEGLLVSQHHFQQQDRYHETLLRERLQATLHYDWGITEIEIDERALVSNQFKLKKFSAVWPDGVYIRCGEGEGEPAPPPRSFEAAFTADASKLDVFLGLAHEVEGGANVAVPGEPNQPRRFAQQSRAVADANTGTSAQEVDWARPNLQLFFGSERKDGFGTIRIAEIVRKPNGQPIVRDNYVPPVLHIAAAPFLSSGLQRVLAAITARQRQLSADRKQRQAGSVDFHHADASKFWMLHTLNGAIPSLVHLLDNRRAHPEEAYLLLSTLVGQLCTFAPDVDPLSLPKFNYVDLGDPFEVLFARVLSLLSGEDQKSYVEIPLEHRPDGMFIGKIPDPKLVSHEFFVAVKAGMTDALVRERVPAVLKIAGWNHIYEVVKQARHGVRVDIEWHPSSALPVKPGLCFFRVRREGPYWEEIAKSVTVALYMPVEADWAGAGVSLYAVDAANLR